MAELLTPAVEDDERPVEEVRCTYTGIPITTIPAWYAGVKVKFFSEASRKATAAAIAMEELEAGRLRDSVSDDDDTDTDDLDADLELDDDAEEETDDDATPL